MQGPVFHPGMSLRGKAVVIVLGLQTLTVCAAGAAAILLMRGQSFADHRRSARTMAEGLALASRVAVYSGDSEEMDRLVSGLIEDPHVSFVALHNPDGVVLAHMVRSEADWRDYRRAHSRLHDHSLTVTRQGYSLAESPVNGLEGGLDLGLFDGGAEDEHASAPIGAAVVGLSLEPLRATIRGRTLAMAGAFALAAVAAVPLVWWIVGGWTLRLSRLVAASGRIAAGEFDEPVHDAEQDEIGALARAYEQMRAAVAQRDREIRSWNDRLREEVRSQTAELEERSYELEAALMAAEEASRAKTDFLANMSHEIRTPMTAILGYAELLEQGGQGEADREYAVNTIRRSGNHLLMILNDILDFAKIEAGRLTVERMDCELGPIVSEVASLMRAKAVEKGLALTVRAVGPIPRRIHTDPTRLRQVLMNLVGNAVKFTSAGNVEIELEFIDDPPTLRLSVRDTGIGMSEKQLACLFQPFSQGDESMSRRFGGTGLGLAITRRLTDILGGTVGVSSEEGRGSEFTVYLPTGPVGPADLVPFEADALAAGAHVSRLHPPPRLEARVLLAEDGPDNRRLLTAHLEHAGATVETAENGRTAFEKAMASVRAGRPFDVILMDMQMPVIDGYTATRMLRDAGYSGPVIALTAHAMSTDRARCLDAGCDDYASKPIDSRSLVEKCAAWVGRRRAA